MDTATQLMMSWFPKLKEDKLFKLTSPSTPKYNCIAWAAEINDFNLWPYTNSGIPSMPDGMVFRWPRDIAKDFSVNAFQALFYQFGYESCQNIIERGYDYICLYVNDDDEVTHAARKLPDGSWTSKLGPYQDISHSLHALEGDIYGTVRCIMRRKSDNSR